MSFPAPEIFKAYDIRGIVDKTLTAEAVRAIGHALGSEAVKRGQRTIAVGRDGRLSGPELASALAAGINAAGVDVLDIGCVPTPLSYFAAFDLGTDSAVSVTGSHNPPDYNGLKMVLGGQTLYGDMIQDLRRRIVDNDLVHGQGTTRHADVRDTYITRVTGDVKLKRRMKVVIDCGNGVAGDIAPRLFEALGCEVVPLFCEVDGNYPNHHPDPSKPENLEDVIRVLAAGDAEIGLAFDGDGDRLGVVTRDGEIIYPDRQLMLFAADVLSRQPGAQIVYDVKCTRLLAPWIREHGGEPVMWNTGHALIKAKLKQSGAALAGEMSGHMFFKERWFGFDDGVYAAARLLEILSQDKRDADQIFGAFPNDISTPEINIQVTEQNKFGIIERLQRDAVWGEGNITSLDGVRVDYPKGWGLVRASNTTPVLVLRFEAENEAELERIKEVFRAQLYSVIPELDLPF